MNISLAVLLPIIFAAVGAAGTYFTLRRTSAKDNNEEGKASGVILTEIGYIKSGVDDIKRHQEKQDDQYVELRQQVTQNTAAVKSAHKRIDDLIAREEQTHYE